jgi:N-acetyl-gamma-glutamyl-phosphate reductase
LSGDFRLKDPTLYDTWYGMSHTLSELLPTAVYGLPEVRKDAIRQARLLANPGCYTTASILAARPFIAAGIGSGSPAIIHAISGVSGAGRAAKEENLFISVDSNVRSYRIGSHQHTPEIEQELTIPGADGHPCRSPAHVLFVPHVGPYQDGIMATVYLPLDPSGPVSSQQDCEDILRQAYQGQPFVRIRPATAMPQIAHVVGTNFCDIGVTVDLRTETVIVVSCIDNLIKGAAGQAVQNMNLMFGFEETTALL